MDEQAARRKRILFHRHTSHYIHLLSQINQKFSYYANCHDLFRLRVSNLPEKKVICWVRKGFVELKVCNRTRKFTQMMIQNNGQLTYFLIVNKMFCSLLMFAGLYQISDYPSIQVRRRLCYKVFSNFL